MAKRTNDEGLLFDTGEDLPGARDLSKTGQRILFDVEDCKHGDKDTDTDNQTDDETRDEA